MRHNVDPTFPSKTEARNPLTFPLSSSQGSSTSLRFHQSEATSREWKQEASIMGKDCTQENHLLMNGALTLRGSLWVMVAELCTVKLLSPRESKAVDYFWLSRSFSMPMREFWAIEYSLIRVFITGKNEFFSLQQKPWPIHKDKFRYRSIFINFAFNMMIEGLHPFLEIFSICWKLIICSTLFFGNVLFTYTKYVHM